MRVVIIGVFPEKTREHICGSFPADWELHIVRPEDAEPFLGDADAVIPEHISVDGLSSTIRTADQMEALGVKVQPGQYLSGHEGYFIWKTRLLQEDNVSPGTQPWFVWTNYRVMRYAEVLLLAAEAHVQGGDATKALNYINQIRDRARLAPLSAVTLDDVKKEKRLELCLESVRFQDLVRWGDAESFLAEQGKQIPAFTGAETKYMWSNPTYGFKAKHKLLPIPRKEMELNPNMKQNEGWQ